MFIKRVLITITIFILFLTPISAFAAVGFGMDETANKAGLDMTGPGELPKLIGRVIGTGLSLVGVLFFALMLYGGLTWMLAHGNSEQESKALSTIMAAIIGIIIVLASYTITNFVFKSVEPSVTTAPAPTPTVLLDVDKLIDGAPEAPLVEEPEDPPIDADDGTPEPEALPEPEAPLADEVVITCTKNATQANCESGCKFVKLSVNSTPYTFCVTVDKESQCKQQADSCVAVDSCKYDVDCQVACTQTQLNCLNL